MSGEALLRARDVTLETSTKFALLAAGCCASSSSVRGEGAPEKSTLIEWSVVRLGERESAWTCVHAKTRGSGRPGAVRCLT